MTRHPGVFTGWVSKPQVTFFSLTPGREPPSAVPANIGLVFRLLEPEAVQGTTLVLSCPARTDSIGVKPASYVTPTGNTRSHILTYTLPTDRVAAFAACQDGTLAIAQVRVEFRAAEIGGIRALLVAVGAGRGR